MTAVDARATLAAPLGVGQAQVVRGLGSGVQPVGQRALERGTVRKGPVVSTSKSHSAWWWWYA